ncbi:MAG: hypothetical protein AAGJ52_08800 [Pseudomonadota bacterium]
MSELIRLLKDLGQDAKLAAAFEQDPDSVLKHYDLSDEAIKALKAGDIDAIRKLSGLDDVHMTNSTIKSH